MKPFSLAFLLPRHFHWGRHEGPWLTAPPHTIDLPSLTGPPSGRPSWLSRAAHCELHLLLLPPKFSYRTESNSTLKKITTGGWPCGQVVKFVRSAAGGPVFCWFESWARTWHCSSNHAEAASHMPQLEGPTAKNIQLCIGGLWGEKGKK